MPALRAKADIRIPPKSLRLPYPPQQAVGLKKALDIVPLSDLKDWPTRRLLARLKRLRWCYETPTAAADYTAAELAAVADKLLFKSDPRWKTAYGDVKSVLAAREHVKAKI